MTEKLWRPRDARREREPRPFRSDPRHTPEWFKYQPCMGCSKPLGMPWVTVEHVSINGRATVTRRYHLRCAPHAEQAPMMVEIRTMRLFAVLLFLCGLCVGIAVTLAAQGRMPVPRWVQP